MAISKKITLTIDGYSCKLSSSLQFYRNDALHLIFSINEYGITVSGNGIKSRVLTPLTPLSGFLLIETPDNVDELNQLKATLCSLISNATSDLVAIEKLKRDYEAKLENLTQGSEE